MTDAQNYSSNRETKGRKSRVWNSSVGCQDVSEEEKKEINAVIKLMALHVRTTTFF